LGVDIHSQSDSLHYNHFYVLHFTFPHFSHRTFLFTIKKILSPHVTYSSPPSVFRHQKLHSSLVLSLHIHSSIPWLPGGFHFLPASHFLHSIQIYNFALPILQKKSQPFHSPIAPIQNHSPTHSHMIFEKHSAPHLTHIKLSCTHTHKTHTHSRWRRGR